jgi:uncharacterized protein YegL
MTGDSPEAGKTALVDVLLRVPVMREPDGRALVLDELADRGYRLDAMRYSRDRHDIWSIVTACLRQPGALAALVEVLRGVEGEQLAVGEFSRIAGQFTPKRSPAQASDDVQSTDPEGDFDSFIRAIRLEHGESTSVFPDVRRERLPCGSKLGAGARGKVFSLLNDPGLVYKEYISGRVNGAALAELILQRNMLSDTERKLLDGSTSWPLARVMADRHVVGCLMRSLPADFYVLTSAGRRPAYLSYLCYPPKPTWKSIGTPSVQDRLEIARQVVNLIGFFQRYSLIVGDISAQNLLWTCEGAPRVFLLGCDALRLVGGSSALPEGETPDWRDPLLGSRAPDMDSDNYKVALVVGRILSQEPYVRPGETLRLLEGVPDGVASGVRECFAAATRTAGRRPAIQNWSDALSIPQALRIRWPVESPPIARSVLPVYVVCDVTKPVGKSDLSYSDELAGALLEMSSDPTVADKIRVCIAVFSDQARVLLPLSDLSEGIGMPEITYEGNVRRYGPVFTLMKSLMERDARNLGEEAHDVMRPMMIFISGGAPADEWRSSYRQLVNARVRPDIFTWGVGAVEQAGLTEIANKYNFSGTDISPSVILSEYASAFMSSDLLRRPNMDDTDPVGFQPIDLEYLDSGDNEPHAPG